MTAGEERLYRDWLAFASSEKVSDPDGAQHPEGRFGHRGQTPFPQHLCCRGTQRQRDGHNSPPL